MTHHGPVQFDYILLMVKVFATLLNVGLLILVVAIARELLGGK